MPGLEDELGDIVAKARTGLGLSVATLAARSGISEPSLKAVEVYTVQLAEAQVRRLAEVLDLRPDQLWELAQDTWSAPAPPWKIGETYTIDRLTNAYPEHCYVLTSTAPTTSGQCIIVDPGDEPDRIIETASRDGRQACAILITHRHQDHTGALVPVQRATGAPVYVQASDGEGAAGVPQSAVHHLEGDGRFQAAGDDIQVLHTPGHTAGSATFVIAAAGQTAAFCGDTLFAGSAGRAGFSYAALLTSVRQKLAGLPRNTILYPGHGPATTLENEAQRNPFF